MSRTEKRRWQLLVALSFGNATLEALAAVSIFTMIALVSNTHPVPTNPVLSALRHLTPWDRGSSLVVAFAVFVAVFYLVKDASQMLQVYLQQRLTNRIASRVATDIVSAYLYMPYEEYFSRNSAEFIRNATVSTDAVYRSVLQSATVVISEGLMVVALLAILFIKAPLVTLIAAGFLIALIGPFYAFFRPRFSRWGQLSQDLSAATIGTLQAGFGAVKEVTVLRRRSYFVHRFESQRIALARVFWNSSSMAELPRYVIEVTFVVLLAVIVAFVESHHNESGTVAVLGLYAYAAFRLMPSANRVVTQMNNVRYGAAAVGIVKAELESIRDRPIESDLDLAEIAPRAGILVLERISYAYPNSTAIAVREVSITVEPGTSLAIVGSSGSGKSTLLDLVLGVLEPTSGTISVDGQPLKLELRSWQRSIGYVAQSSFLIDDTIMRNVALAVPDPEIDSGRVWEALTAAQLDDFVRSLPDGLDTGVGERGILMSGGQRQRLALARALYQQPPVLILDEATSALDAAIESAVVAAVLRDRYVKTLILVAHRLTTVRSCDRVICMGDGQVVDQGTYDEVIGRNPWLAGLTSHSANGDPE